MAHALNVFYETDQGDDPIVLTTPDEVRALFATVRDKYPDESAVLLMIFLADDPWGSELAAGIDGDKGVLRYAGEDTPPDGLYSNNTSPSNTDRVVYYYQTSDREFPTDSEVPITAVESAVIEYMTTGQQPTVVDWQTDSDPAGD